MAAKGFTPKTVLGIEDDNAAYLLLELALGELGDDYALLRARDGQEALDLLRRTGIHEDSPRPDVILLNLHLPRMSGMDLLKIFRSEQLIENIPVIVFTSSELNSERAQCLALGAKEFVKKPHNYDELLLKVKHMCAGI